MSSSIQDIFSFYKKDFVNSYHLSFQQLKVLNHITSCRTPSMGGFVSTCDDCHNTTALFHSCRDRHCPVCQGSKQMAWAEAQMGNALPVKYFHIVFTIPDSLHSLFLQNQKVCYDMLFEASSKAVFSLCASEKSLGFSPGFTSVLHTWSQTLQYHPHIHLIIPAGGLSTYGTQFVRSSNKFFLPVKLLSKTFRTILLKMLKRKFLLAQHFIDELCSKPFATNIKKPFNSPTNVIRYLARYTQKVAISDSRITGFDKDSGMVTFSYKDNRQGGRKKLMSLHALEFMRRFFLHVLPKKFTKIRHYGFLANRSKQRNIDRCYRLLGLIRKSKPPILMNKCTLCGGLISFQHFTARSLWLMLLKGS